MRVLVIDDDVEICSLLKKVIEENQWECELAYNGLEGIEKLQSTPFDLVLLDLNLPYQSGDSVLIKLRAFSDIPVIVISAKGLVTTKIDLLKIGADDYVTKPFDIDEVIARSEAVMRRNAHLSKNSSNELWHKNLRLNLNEKRVFIEENEVQLTGTEFKILELLIKHPNKVFSKQNIFESVWKDAYYDDGHTINVHVSSLRGKLSQINSEVNYIETVWGIGYRLVKSKS
ncbi:response regulator transcription factor [Enterococcus malodoratus]|uniref:response regulator transcription factor n=1 Tax=Enterococcus malodoratus TaxID=71451 RepID=UPI003FD3E175